MLDLILELQFNVQHVIRKNIVNSKEFTMIKNPAYRQYMWDVSCSTKESARTVRILH